MIVVDHGSVKNRVVKGTPVYATLAQTNCEVRITAGQIKKLVEYCEEQGHSLALFNEGEYRFLQVEVH